MTPKLRHQLLGLSVALTAALIWFAPDSEPPPVSAKAPKPAGSEGPVRSTKVPGTGVSSSVPGVDPAGYALKPEQLVYPERTLQGDVVNLFAAASWYVPPVEKPLTAPPPPPPPPPPTAPPLPFRFMGQITEEGRVLVFLNSADRLVSAVVGDNIDKNYRLDGFDGRTLTFTYLPLSISQILVTGVAQ